MTVDNCTCGGGRTRISGTLLTSVIWAKIRSPLVIAFTEVHVAVGCESLLLAASGRVSCMFSKILPRICDLDPALRMTL